MDGALVRVGSEDARMRGRVELALVAALAAAVAACAGAGAPTLSPSPATGSIGTGGASTAPAETVHPGSPAPVATPAPTPVRSPAEDTPMPVFSLSSSAFAEGGSIPRDLTCDGGNTSPELAWQGAPAGTEALVLVVDDPDAGGFVHWLVLDLPGAGHGTLAAGILPTAADPRQGTNDFGHRGWGGPCPPSGEHRYTFTLYALAAPLGLADAASRAAVRRALAGANVLGKAVLQAHYRRAG
jgi:Raf kinase inhibitor-like YbhB/YbcL family protein